MFDAIAPLLGLAFFYLVIAIAGKAARKASEAQKATLAAAQAKVAANQVSESAPAPESAAAPRISELQPTIRVTEHDDSVYRGSLNAVTGEGYDPCHDAQMASLTHAAAIEPAAPVSPGLQLNWTGDEIVRGFVISEILKRKGA